MKEAHHCIDAIGCIGELVQEGEMHQRICCACTVEKVQVTTLLVLALTSIVGRLTLTFAQLVPETERRTSPACPLQQSNIYISSL